MEDFGHFFGPRSSNSEARFRLAKGEDCATFGWNGSPCQEEQKTYFPDRQACRLHICKQSGSQDLPWKSASV